MSLGLHIPICIQGLPKFYTYASELCWKFRKHRNVCTINLEVSLLVLFWLNDIGEKDISRWRWGPLLKFKMKRWLLWYSSKKISSRQWLKQIQGQQKVVSSHLHIGNILEFWKISKHFSGKFDCYLLGLR